MARAAEDVVAVDPLLGAVALVEGAEVVDLAAEVSAPAGAVVLEAVAPQGAGRTWHH